MICYIYRVCCFLTVGVFVCVCVCIQVLRFTGSDPQQVISSSLVGRLGRLGLLGLGNCEHSSSSLDSLDSLDALLIRVIRVMSFLAHSLFIVHPHWVTAAIESRPGLSWIELL